jgi:glycyl-tRNA synthetase beta chain
LPLDLKELLQQAIQNYPFKFDNKNVLTNTFDFIMERLRTWYGEQGITADVFAAVIIRQPSHPLDFHHRILAVQHFRTLPEAQALTAANKRVSNILKKEDLVSIHSKVNPSLFEQNEEHELGDLLMIKSKEVEKLCQQTKYTDALTTLATLQKSVDNFFDHVLVMAEDKKIRENRLALLMNLRNLFLQIADISLLQI